MKQIFALLLLSAAMVFTLAACGNDSTVEEMPGSVPNSGMNDPVTGGSAYDSTMPNDGSYDSAMPSDGSYDSTMPSDGMVSDGAVIDPTVEANPQSHSGRIFKGASYDQMVRNAKVHDRDGNLNDGENAHTPGIRVF